MSVGGLATQVPGIAVRASIQFTAFCHDFHLETKPIWEHIEFEIPSPPFFSRLVVNSISPPGSSRHRLDFVRSFRQPNSQTQKRYSKQPGRELIGVVAPEQPDRKEAGQDA
jgi:hypothetical protein